MRAAALPLLLLLPLAGCVGVDDARVPACASVADCLLDPRDDPLTVFTHASPGLALRADAATALAGEVLRIAGRGVEFQDGSPVPPLPGEVDEDALRALHADGQDPAALHLYVVDATHLVAGEPASGLSFPGAPPVFLFPGTMDLRVAQAGLTGEAAESARARLEAVVLAHELGHVLGLVGCGLPMVSPHDDSASPCHSANRTSVMHARVARVAEWPAWEPAEPLSPFGWDADDLADIQARRAELAA